MKNILILLTSILILNSVNLFAQLEPDVRLTNDPAFSSTAFNNAWSVAASGNIVHVVWRDNRDGNDEIYYKHSTNDGVSWSSDIRLTNDPATSRNPSVSVNGLAVHVVWPDERDGANEIYYKSSTDGGITWGADIRLTNNMASAGSPSLSVSGSTVHVVWEDYRNLNNEIYYKHSTDGGVSWETDIRLTNNPATSWTPSISVSGSIVHVLWWENRDGNNEIYYKRSTDGGTSWEADTRLTNNFAFSSSPSVSVSNSVVHVVWVDDRDGNPEIYYKRSTDGGSNWGTDTRLTNNSAASDPPSLSVSDSFVHFVWFDERDGNFEIYYKRSTDGGASWEADTRLTNNSAFSSRPSVSVSNSFVHVVWHDNRDGNWEIYYKRDPTGNVTSIENNGSELPEEFNLEQNYPNPFNPSTTIKYSIPSVIASGAKQSQLVTLKVYDVLGNEVATLVNEEKPAGVYEVEFNASGLSSGIYFYKIQTSSFVETKKMILLQ